MKIIHLADKPRIAASHEDTNTPGVYKQVLLALGDVQSGSLQMLNWATLPAGHKFNPHHHQDMEEVFVMIAGRATIQVGEEKAEIIRGDVVVVPPLVDHSMVNSSQEVVEYIVFGISRGSGGKTVVVG